LRHALPSLRFVTPVFAPVFLSPLSTSLFLINR